MNRERHCTVAQLREAIKGLQDDDVLCFVIPTTGNLGVLRDEEQIGWVDLAPQDLVGPVPPRATLELF